MSDAIADVRTIIADAITNAPRSLQTALGPSEIGCACDPCLAHMLAGSLKSDATLPWLPTIGTAVHEWIETAILQHLAATGSDRYLPEVVVNVGTLRGQPVIGHCDLFDVHTGTVIDFKVTGKNSIGQARRGAKETYRRQVQLYAAGLAAAGHDVRDVAIWNLPRNHASIDAGHVHTEPYDPQVAADTLARANAIAGGVDALGVDAVLERMGPHTGGEFTCTRYPNPSTAPVVEVTPDAFLGV